MHFTSGSVRRLHRGSGSSKSSANSLFIGNACCQRCLCERHFFLEQGVMSSGLLKIVGHLADGGIPLLAFLLGALPSRARIALSFLRDSDLGAKLLRVR